MKRHGRKINMYSEFKKAAWKCNTLHESTYGPKEKGNYGYSKNASGFQDGGGEGNKEVEKQPGVFKTPKILRITLLQWLHVIYIFQTHIRHYVRASGPPASCGEDRCWCGSVGWIAVTAVPPLLEMLMLMVLCLCWDQVSMGYCSTDDCVMKPNLHLRKKGLQNGSADKVLAEAWGTELSLAPM